MRKIVVFLLLIPLCSFALRQKPYSEGYDWVADKCNSMQCIDENLEIIDNQISILIAKRMAYVKRGAQIKTRNVRLPNQPRSEEESLRGVKGRAKIQGYDPGAASSIFKEINKQSSEYEKQYLDNKQ